MSRARAIVILNGAVALIERHRPGRHYYLFPGGGVEPGEAPHEAAVREAREEVGLDVAAERMVAEVWYRGEAHQFFATTVLGGAFGSGDGPEMRGLEPAENGTYAAVWMPVQRLPDIPVFPRDVADLIVAALVEGWPPTPLVCCELDTDSENASESRNV